MMKVKELACDNYRASGQPLQTHTRLAIPNNRQKKKKPYHLAVGENIR